MGDVQAQSGRLGRKNKWQDAALPKIGVVEIPMILESSTRSCCLWVSKLEPRDTTATTKSPVHREEGEGLEQENSLARFLQSFMEGRRRFLTEALRHGVERASSL